MQKLRDWSDLLIMTTSYGSFWTFWGSSAKHTLRLMDRFFFEKKISFRFFWHLIGTKKQYLNLFTYIYF
jgi:hypothetical protein